MMNLKANPSRGWILTLSAAVSVAAYVLIGLVPAQKSIASLRRELTEKRQFLANSDLQAASQGSIDQQLEFTRQHVQHWRSSAPKDQNLIDLLGKLSAVAKETGVTLQKLSPREPTKMTVVRQHTFNVEMSGDFASLFEFLSRVESFPETIWLQNLHLHPADKDGLAVQCAVTLIVFADNRDKSG